MLKIIQVLKNSKQLTGFYQLSLSTMPKKALVLLAEGSEDMETVITVDLLRRGGVEVILAGVDTPDPIKCSNGIRIVPDQSFTAAESGDYDAIVLPGGLGGTKIFATNPKVGKLLERYANGNKLVAAICAAPTALKAHGILKGRALTSYPSMAEDMKDSYTYKEDRVVVDGNLVTSRGPATAFDFGLELVKQLSGEEIAEKVAKGTLWK